ncbi:unnamed protein product [Aureobasidium uvarum]|uniref:Uncharacterized protein n=1 Tax=Aureobasidium uvarum TaxID=2773716 RepID=A0A9N8KIR0_9PEZI|nr:unnamed protein product [Aureobasidium uvarum]
MLWLSTPDIDHDAIILDIWKDPQSTILDLIKQIGASLSTLDCYTDRPTPDWAVRRFSDRTLDLDCNDPSKAFEYAVEHHRYKDSRREAVDVEILQKLEGCHYGQLRDTLFKTLPTEIQDHPDSHSLNMVNMEGCDHARWSGKAIAHAIAKDPRLWSNRSKRSNFLDQKSSKKKSLMERSSEFA